jgi:hypothetical protein
MRRFIEALRRLWRDRVAGPQLRTYDAAREELGGVPWRNFNSTERWFIPVGGGAGADSRPLTLDTSALLLARPTLLERVKGKEKWFLGGAAACVIIVCTIALSSRSAASARPHDAFVPASLALAAPPTLAPAPIVAPGLAAPGGRHVAIAKKKAAKTVATPTATATTTTTASSPRHGMSPSVRSLFAGGKSDSPKAVARKTKKGRRARGR